MITQSNCSPPRRAAAASRPTTSRLIGSGSGRPAGRTPERRRDLVQRQLAVAGVPQRCRSARRRSAARSIVVHASAGAGRRRSAARAADTTRSASAPDSSPSASCLRRRSRWRPSRFAQAVRGAAHGAAPRRAGGTARRGRIDVRSSMLCRSLRASRSRPNPRGSTMPPRRISGRRRGLGCAVRGAGSRLLRRILRRRVDNASAAAAGASASSCTAWPRTIRAVSCVARPATRSALHGLDLRRGVGPVCDCAKLPCGSCARFDRRIGVHLRTRIGAAPRRRTRRSGSRLAAAAPPARRALPPRRHGCGCRSSTRRRCHVGAPSLAPARAGFGAHRTAASRSLGRHRGTISPADRPRSDGEAVTSALSHSTLMVARNAARMLVNRDHGVAREQLLGARRRRS